MTEEEARKSPIPWLPREHDENRRKFPLDQLLAYAGQLVAWSWEGDRIVGHADSYESLFRQLAAANVDSQRVVFEYIDDT